MKLGEQERQQFEPLKRAIDMLAQGNLFGSHAQGRLLAAFPLTSWPPSFFSVAWEIAKRHAEFLTEKGIDVQTLPQPPEPGNNRFIGLHHVEGFAVFFEPLKEIRASVKGFPSSEFVSDPAHWVVYPVQGTGASLLHFAQTYQFQLGAGVIAYAEEIDANPRPLLCRRMILSPDRRNGHSGIDVYFPYTENVLDEIREIVGRFFVKTPPHWWVPAAPYQARNLLDVALHHQFSIDSAAVPTLRALDEQADQFPPQPPVRRIDYDEDAACFWVHFPPNRQISGEIERIAGTQFAERGELEKGWTIPATGQALAALSDFRAIHPEFVCSADVQIQMQHHLARIEDRVQASTSGEASLSISGLGGDLRPCQLACVAYAQMVNYQVLIGDEVGVGKTPEALAIIHYTQSYPALVIAQASLKWNWAAEVERWLPDKTVRVLEGTTSDIGDYDADVIIVNYDLLTARLDEMRAAFERRGGLKVIVSDESQLLKNPAAKRTQAALALSDGVPVRLALSGTPVLNRPIELATQLEFLGRLHLFGGFWRFARRYCNARPAAYGGWDFDGASNTEELHRLLQETCYIRRLKKDVLAELPEVQVEMVRVDIDNWKEYQRAERETIAWLREQSAQNQRFLATLSGLSDEQRKEVIEEHMTSREARARRALHLARIEALKQVAVRGKLAAIREWLETFLASGEKLVVFAHHTQVQQQLLAWYPDAARILGDMKATERHSNVRRFQEEKDCQLIVCSLKAAKEGITLTAASHVALLELGWTPADIDQPIGRVHRQTQEASSVTLWLVLAARTIEVTIAQLIDKKRAVIDSTIDGVSLSSEDKSVFGELVALLSAQS